MACILGECRTYKYTCSLFFWKVVTCPGYPLFIGLHCLKFQLICTVTPSSSSSEETHNTLKFAHRAKHIEILAAQNKVLYLKRWISKISTQ